MSKRTKSAATRPSLTSLNVICHKTEFSNNSHCCRCWVAYAKISNFSEKIIHSLQIFSFFQLPGRRPELSTFNRRAKSRISHDSLGFTEEHSTPAISKIDVARSYETEFMGDGRKLSFSWRYSFSLNEIMYRYIGFGFILPYEATKQSSSINNCSIIPTESCWARS